MSKNRFEARISLIASRLLFWIRLSCILILKKNLMKIAEFAKSYMQNV